jgi:hypothetical protein
MSAAKGDLRMKPRAALCLVMVLSTLRASAQQVQPVGDLPIRHVVLYKHGIGYFQRSGQLGSGSTARLDFKAEEMNDVLKSLTIQEAGGGAVAGLRYDSSDPLEKKLAEFPFRLQPGQPLSAILDQLKGAQIELRIGGDTVRGSLIGARILPATDQRPQSEQLTLLVNEAGGGEFRNVDLSAASSIRFTDPTLQAQFAQYLTTLHAARSSEKRSVYIDGVSSGNGTQPRQVVASYMIPTPVWKSSYRLIFDGAAEPTLEGWAIVDNTTGDDWSNVQLSLVSGRPVSFISNLYAPRYQPRPVADLPGDQAQAPVIYGGAVEQERDEAAQIAKSAERQERVFVGGVVGGIMPSAPPAQMRMSTVAPSAIANTAEAQELGELFEYSFAKPVTVRKSESAMLPFLQDKLAARKLLVFTENGSVHPMHSVEITNSTGKTLDGGPITVYEANAYAGEALVETLKRDDKRLISYGVDLGTRISTALDSESQIVREIHVRRGLLTTRTAAVETKMYTINNVDQEGKTLIIQHPIRREYKVMNQKPVESTEAHHRFEVPLAAGATAKYPVTEERVYETSLAVASLTPDVLVAYIMNKSLTDAARGQLQQVLDLKRQIAANEGETQRTQRQIESLFQDQERIRQNINSLNRVAGQEQQVQTYSRQLASQEAQLATLRDKVAQLQQAKVSLESQLSQLIERMEF